MYTNTYLSKLIPKLVKVGIVRAMSIVAKLMKHGIKNLVKGKEIPVSIWPSKPQLYLNASSYIKSQKRRIFGATIHTIYETKESNLLLTEYNFMQILVYEKTYESG